MNIKLYIVTATFFDHGQDRPETRVEIHGTYDEGKAALKRWVALFETHKRISSDADFQRVFEPVIFEGKSGSITPIIQLTEHRSW